MSEQKQTKAQTEALKLLGSPRGQYIVGQALALAVKQLKELNDEGQETIISDMEFLGNSLFMAGYVTHSMLSPELLEKIKNHVGNDPDKLIEDTELVAQINAEVKKLK